MPKKKIDIVSNGTASQYDIIVEDNTDEVGAFSPARALQVNGKLLSDSNQLPTKGELSLIDPVTPANKLAINASGQISVSNIDLPALVGGRLPVTIQSITNSFYSNYSTATRAGAVVIKNSPGRLVALDLYSVAAVGTANLFLQFHNTTSIPAATTRCRRFFTIFPDNALLIYGASDMEIDFETGITAVISTTPDTYTVATQAAYDNIYFTVTYR